MLRIENVSKRFTQRGLVDTLRRRPPRAVQALHGVSIEVKMGACVALLGPNGAGKTTLMGICAGLIYPDAGHVEVLGCRYPKKRTEALRRVGMVTTSDRSFFWRLSGRQNLHFFAALQGIEPAEAQRRSHELLQTFGLSAHADRRYLSYSTGMKKRLALARALLHDPSVLLLDEATNGLDAEGAEQLLESIRELVIDRGKAVLWATHRSEEIGVICDAVVVLIEGQVRYRDTIPAFLRFQHEGSGLRLELRGAGGAPDPIERVLRRHELSGRDRPEGLQIIVPPGRGDEAISSLLRDLLDAGARLDRLQEERPSLARLFERLRAHTTAGGRGDGEASP